jgi:hypothetical protein
MSKIKIKSKVVKSTLQNKDVIDMFHGVIGTDGASISIVHPKYQLIEKNVKRFLQVLDMLYNEKFLDFFTTFKDNLDMYLFSLRRQFVNSFNAPNIDNFLMDNKENPIIKVSKERDYLLAKTIWHFNYISALKLKLKNILLFLNIIK